MTATEELRRLLDERGVEWMDDSYAQLWCTVWHGQDGKQWRMTENQSGMLTELKAWKATPAQAIAATLGPTVTGETSDGFHTMAELYHHRAVLFSVIVRDHPELAWKSKLHSDGTMYDGMFIVGIETPQGQATYHYDIEPYWEMFDCKELGQAPEWDGHTPDDAIARIATLGISDATVTRQGGAGTCYPVPIYGFDGEFTEYDCNACSACGTEWDGDMPNFCPNCGRRVVETHAVTCHLLSALQYGDDCKECSACGAVSDEYMFESGRCPSCGAKVVDEWTDELRPCPFCGSNAEAVHTLNVVPHEPWWVRCPSCGVTTPKYSSETDAIAAWNRRVK